MKEPLQLAASHSHTIDLGYEQMLILDNEADSPVGVLFRGDWLQRLI